jgi:hypothetical protein
MALSRNISRYADVADIFSQAAVAGGGEVQFPRRSDATQWRSRAYYYRTLLREASEAKKHSSDPAERAEAGTTPYDDFFLRLDGTSVTIFVQPPVIGTFIPRSSNER